MKSSAAFSYVQARLQARHGRRPEEAHWRRLDACDTAHAYLQAAQAGPLAPWVEGLRIREDPRALERKLHESWQRYVARVAAWSPPPWIDAVAWCGGLLGLPSAAEGADGETLRAWRDEWRRRMPAGADELRGVAELERRVADWMAANRRVGDATAARAGELRATLERQAVSVFRRHARGPAAIFAHLLLSALDLQRLRGGLLTRRVLASPGTAGSAS